MKVRLGLAILLCAFVAAPAAADSLLLFEVGVNIDGTTYSTVDGSPIDDAASPLSAPAIDSSAFDYVTGLGSITVTVMGAGPHFVIGYFDLEYVGDNNDPFNEMAELIGTAPIGLSFETGDPFCCDDTALFPAGVYYNAFKYDLLVNENNATSENDVAVALGWDFLLAPNEFATLRFVVSPTDPGGFALRHLDIVPGVAPLDVAYYRSTLNIREEGVPEPGTLLLVGAGLALIRLRRRR